MCVNKIYIIKFQVRLNYYKIFTKYVNQIITLCYKLTQNKKPKRIKKTIYIRIIPVRKVLNK